MQHNNAPVQGSGVDVRHRLARPWKRLFKYSFYALVVSILADVFTSISAELTNLLLCLSAAGLVLGMIVDSVIMFARSRKE